MSLRSTLTALAAVLLLILLTLGYCTVTKGQRSAAEAEKARSGQVVAEGGQAAAVDALGASEKAADARAASDQLTGANRDEILSTPGADASLGGVHGAGLRSICRREAYRSTERCAGVK